jgi:lipase
MALHVHEWGDPEAPPVVCLHGVTGHGGRYRKLAEERLAADFRVVAVDLRGHGHSPWEPPWRVETHVGDVLDIAEGLGIDCARWIGHSFGGRVVTELASSAPERVERAVLLDPALHVPPGDALLHAEEVRVDQSFASADEAIDQYLAGGTLFHTARADLEEYAAAHLAAGEDGRLRWRFCRAAVVAAWSEMSRPAPPAPSAPTLVVLGERSWLRVHVPDAPQVETVSVPGGHVVLWDAFDETADAVERFLEPASGAHT